MKYNAVLFDYGDTLRRMRRHAMPSFIASGIKSLYDSGYRLGVVSNSDRYGDARWLRQQLATDGLIEYFEIIIGSGSSLGVVSNPNASPGCHKPNPLIYSKAINTLAMPIEKCIYVGDALEYDIIPTRALGMEALLVDLRDGDYFPRLWNLLEDTPTDRPNLITTYSVTPDSRVSCRLRHLSAPLAQNQHIIIGVNEAIVQEWDVEHTKEDILDTGGKGRDPITFSVVFC